MARTPGNGRDVMDGPAHDVAASGLRGWAFVREGKGWSARAAGYQGRPRGQTWASAGQVAGGRRAPRIVAECRGESRGETRLREEKGKADRRDPPVSGYWRRTACGISWAGAGRRRCGPRQGCVRARGLGRGTASDRAEQASRASGVSWLDGFRPGLVRE